MPLVAMLLAYLIGGIPIGLFVGRARGIADIRDHGSGNIGASNALRLLGAKAGALVWVGDCGKGLLPVLLARHFLGLETWALGLTGVAATAGHCFSPYLRLTGGRGVSTGLGVMLALFWPCGLLSLLVFVAVVAATRYISVGSICGSSSAPLWMLLLLSAMPGLARFAAPYAVSAGLCAVLIDLRHLPNIQRLILGTERRIGQKESVPSDEDAASARGEGGSE